MKDKEKNIDRNNKDTKKEKQSRTKDWMNENITKTAILRILLAIIGGVVFGMFTNPYLGGVINIGNITGMVVSILIMAYSLLFDIVNAGFKKLVKSKRGRRIVAAVSLVASVAIVTFVVTATLMVTATTKSGSGNEVLIVLGCKVDGDQPSSM